MNLTEDQELLLNQAIGDALVAGLDDWEDWNELEDKIDEILDLEG